MKVFVVGDTGLLDGLALWSTADDGDVLLYVKNDEIPTQVRAELDRLDPDIIVICGGTMRVSQAVEDELAATWLVVRLAGATRFDTPIEIAKAVRPPEGEESVLAGYMFLTPPGTEPADPPDDPPDPPEGGPPTGGEILGTYDFETGDASQWFGVTISGNGTYEVTSEAARTGSYGAKIIANSGEVGIRFREQTLDGYPDPKNLPDDAIYSCWYNLQFEGTRDNIFQFKYADVDQWDPEPPYDPIHQTRRMLGKISAEWSGTGYDLEYRTRIRQATGEWTAGEADSLALTATDIQIDTWFHIEMRYVWGQDGTGRITVWLDGELLWDLEDVSTEPNNCTYLQDPRQWTCNHYLNDARTTWSYIDDAQLRLTT